MPRPLPELTQDTIAALAVSSARAQALLAESRSIRATHHDDFMRELTQEYRDLGFPPTFVPSGFELSAQYARRVASNVLYKYPAPRYAKILRARFHRYERLKYLYELEHPPFSHPEFPEHPSATMWRAGVSINTKGLGGWQDGVEGRSAASKLTVEDDEISPVDTKPPPAPAWDRDTGEDDQWESQRGEDAQDTRGEDAMCSPS
ncbi:hypothetical protein C8F04DRAFT_1270664 [Mycena alexandri]|uniref:Uncharacterized protein n=1 Tax=Mycena alexandri TaxID=1745969 RepID=A0AAD6SA80_9AGAR|nr:hypothetical protein C8F04DRAFT_1270664 [Mycena alexandri]